MLRKLQPWPEGTEITSEFGLVPVMLNCLAIKVVKGEQLDRF